MHRLPNSVSPSQPTCNTRERIAAQVPGGPAVYVHDGQDFFYHNEKSSPSNAVVLRDMMQYIMQYVLCMRI